MSATATSDASSISFLPQPGPEELQTINANASLLYDKYKDILTTLPKEKGWITENMYMYQGFWLESRRMFSVETVMAAQDVFEARPNDIYLATLQKSGTTWLKALVFAIVNRDQYKNKPISDHPLFNFNPQVCVSAVEVEVLRNNPIYDDTHLPRLFATHMPYTLLPRSILDNGCRIVYMCRNPKDVLVSLYHFANKLRDKSLGLMKFEEAFQMFSKGVIAYGPYWDHVKEYYEASLEHPTRIMFLTYENMKLDGVNNVKHLAEFLGYPFTEEEIAEGVVEEIVSLCSFKNLSEINKQGTVLHGMMPNSIFFREGKVGDWSNHLTTEMSEILDQITKEKFNGLDISF